MPVNSTAAVLVVQAGFESDGYGLCLQKSLDKALQSTSAAIQNNTALPVSSNAAAATSTNVKSAATSSTKTSRTVLVAAAVLAATFVRNNARHELVALSVPRPLFATAKIESEAR